MRKSRNNWEGMWEFMWITTSSHADILLEKPHKSIITPVLQTAGDSLGSPTIGSYITDFFLAGGSYNFTKSIPGRPFSILIQI